LNSEKKSEELCGLHSDWEKRGRVRKEMNHLREMLFLEELDEFSSFVANNS
jgi:hypothetical protein